jgi:hypothetical protein
VAQADSPPGRRVSILHRGSNTLDLSMAGYYQCAL